MQWCQGRKLKAWGGWQCHISHMYNQHSASLFIHHFCSAALPFLHSYMMSVSDPQTGREGTCASWFRRRCEYSINFRTGQAAYVRIQCYKTGVFCSFIFLVMHITLLHLDHITWSQKVPNFSNSKSTKMLSPSGQWNCLCSEHISSSCCNRPLFALRRQCNAIAKLNFDEWQG